MMIGLCQQAWNQGDLQSDSDVSGELVQNTEFWGLNTLAKTHRRAKLRGAHVLFQTSRYYT